MRTTNFKPCEIGPIPADWEVRTIGEMACVCTGNSNTQDKVDTGKYPFYVRSPIVEHINEYGFDTEGVVTVGDGVGTGKVFHYVNGKFALHQRCYLIDRFCPLLDSKFFYKIFSLRFYDRVMQMTAKSSVDSVRREMITGMLIPVPPIPEQRRIAAALSDADAWIESLDKLIEKKKLVKQGAMQALLSGKTRLPGFSGKWVEREVKSMLSIGHGKDYKGLEPGDVPVYGSGGYMCSVAACLYDGPTVCIGRKGTIDKPFYHEGPIWTVDTLFYTHSFVEADPKFVYYAFQRVDWLALNMASGVPSLTAKSIEQVLLEVPPTFSEQRAIASALSDMDAELAALSREKAKAEQIKQGMMQELLTGRVRLVEGE